MVTCSYRPLPAGPAVGTAPLAPTPTKVRGKPGCTGWKGPQKAPVGATLSTCASILAPNRDTFPLLLEDREFPPTSLSREGVTRSCAYRGCTSLHCTLVVWQPRAGISPRNTVAVAPLQMRKPRLRDESHNVKVAESGPESRFLYHPRIWRNHRILEKGPYRLSDPLSGMQLNRLVQGHTAHE